jgi:hypothetical protein
MASVMETLSGIRRGRFLELCNTQLREVVAAVAAHDGKGELQITLTLSPNGEGQVIAKARVKAKKPMPDVGDAIFYATEDGELERQDPKQRDMEDVWAQTTGRARRSDDA